MASIRRVAVTGIGAISSIGTSLNDNWNSLLEGRSGISKIEGIPTEHLPVKIAGEIKNFKLSENILSKKDSSRYDKFIHYALHSTHEALAHAKLLSENPYKNLRIGCILGVGMGGLPYIEATHKNYLEKGIRQISPFFIPSVVPNMTSGFVSIHYGFTGANYTISSACASSSHAISASAYEIMLGRQDVMVTGGAESVICDLAICGFSNMKALSRKDGDPAKASRPFDKDRDGFVIGEGAGALVLEEYEHAKARGAKIYAEVTGYGMSGDAYHITSPNSDGPKRSMQNALKNAGLNADAVQYVNAHGTSTPLGDKNETEAIKLAFGDHASRLVVNSTKSMTGHLLGGAGGIESIFSVLAIHHQVSPPTINIFEQDPECDLDYCANEARDMKINVAMNNNFGFGGTNGTLVFSKV